MTRSFILSVSLFAAMTSNVAAEEITVSGCAAAGVEANCLVLEADGKTYNITAAQPAPVPGTYGKVTGTLSDKVSMCQQGQVLDPATWEVEPGKACPVDTSQ